MDNHIYMVYDDSSPESTRDADETHKALLDKGFRVIHKEDIILPVMNMQEL